MDKKQIEELKEKDGRFPYTHAADYIRGLAGYNEQGTKLSRSDASKIRSAIAEAIGMEDEALAVILAEREMNMTQEQRDKNVQEFINILTHKNGDV